MRDEILIAKVSATRYCLGYLVNGELVSFDDYPSGQTFTVSNAASSVVIESVMSKDWYVAVDGKDTNSGFTPDAKQGGKEYRLVLNAWDDDGLVFVPVAQGVDPVGSYYKGKSGGNALHPTEAGGQQIGDLIYAWLVNSIQGRN